MLDITDFHGQNAPKEELEEVELLSWQETAKTTGTIDIADGLSNFEYLEAEFGIGSNAPGYGTYKITKEQIAQSADGEDLSLLHATFGTSDYEIRIRRVSETQVDLYNSLAGGGLKSLTGFKKRYATKNLSRTVSVNSGNDIAVNSRYEVDLPSEFYEPDGSIKKGVQVRAEIFVAGTQYSGYGESDLRDFFTGSNYYHRGVRAEIEEDKVVVYSAGFGATVASTGDSLVNNDITNKWGAPGNVVSAPCQVIATLNDAYILSVEPAQGAVQRCTNNDATALSFTSAGDFEYTPLSNTDQDGELFEYNSTTRFMRPKKSGLYNLALTSHTEDGAGVAEITTVLVEADTAAGDNATVFSPALTKVYSSTSDQSSQTVRGNFELDESKWYALYKQNESAGDVDFTTVTDAVVDPDVTGDAVKYAFLFTLKRP